MSLPKPQRLFGFRNKSKTGEGLTRNSLISLTVDETSKATVQSVVRRENEPSTRGVTVTFLSLFVVGDVAFRMT
ncbi:hypothetical protein CEXT_715391 [Caerostris extrusa]|uniref:Uncharacterized protein n=1 Tax=Caerostris extrusa TaxID=172846 RepID=A0AAV4R4K6_CAEEX|nr:hypothetical protein CEXT_715391 [Caerostris extrusa]